MAQLADGVGQDEDRKATHSQDKYIKKGGMIIIVEDLYIQLLLDPAINIELYNPEQGDEEEVEGDEEAKGSPDVGDALLLAGLVGLDSGREGAGVDGGLASEGSPRVQAAAQDAVHGEARLRSAFTSTVRRQHGHCRPVTKTVVFVSSRYPGSCLRTDQSDVQLCYVSSLPVFL